jgi:DNA replication protein DnaC
MTIFAGLPPTRKIKRRIDMNSMTIEKLTQMKLYGMANALKAGIETGGITNTDPLEFISYLIQSEWEDKHARRTQRLSRAARFRTEALLSEIDWTAQRGLDKTVIMKLAEGAFIREHRTVVLTGPTGVGKSFVAQALGSHACDCGYTTAYFNCSKLFPLLREKRIDGSYSPYVTRLAKTHLLILDDFGLLRFDAQDRLSLLEIIEDRYNKSALIVSSQLPVADWHSVIGDPTIADAVCDRIVHKAIRIEMSGLSMRAKDNLPSCTKSA